MAIEFTKKAFKELIDGNVISYFDIWQSFLKPLFGQMAKGKLKAGEEVKAEGVAASTDKVERVDSLGNRDAVLRKVLLSLYGTGEATPSYDDRVNFSLVLGYLTPGQRDVVKEAFAYAGVRETKVERKWTIHGQSPPQAPQPQPQPQGMRRRGQQNPPPSSHAAQVITETSTLTRAEATWYVRQIGQDVASVGVSDVAKRKRAKAIAQLLKDTSALDNLRDDAIAAAEQAKLLTSQADTTGHELRARMKLGFDGALYARLESDPELKAKKAEIAVAPPTKAIRLHEEHQSLLQQKTEELVRSELQKRRWRFSLQARTVFGRNVRVPMIRPGKITASLAIRIIAVTLVITFLITLGWNA